MGNIRNYAVEARGSRGQEMEVDGLDAKTEARLDQTVKELEERLRARKLELDKVGIYSFPLYSISLEPGYLVVEALSPYSRRHSCYLSLNAL